MISFFLTDIKYGIVANLDYPSIMLQPSDVIICRAAILEMPLNIRMFTNFMTYDNICHIQNVARYVTNNEKIPIKIFQLNKINHYKYYEEFIKMTDSRIGKYFNINKIPWKENYIKIKIELDQNYPTEYMLYADQYVGIYHLFFN
uniref:Uncharacterized protein n=1 Tax=Faxonius propinquus nudivirus TaxID=3139431 RepID=A0AAU8GCX4_9VIRU